MVKVFGYILNEEERQSIKYNPRSPAKIFRHSDEKYVYNDKARKISMLLIFSDLVNRVDFEIEEKLLYGELGRISYKNVGTKIDDMKTFGKIVVLEQALIAIVSNWESYFSSVFRKIFNDDNSINTSEHKEGFKKFLKNFRLISDFQEIVILNKNKFEGLNFGTYIIEDRKLNSQNIESVIKLLKLLLDIDIVNLSKNWTEIDKLFEARHILIHNSNDSIIDIQKFRFETKDGKTKLSDVYTKTKIEIIMKDMAKIIDKIDMKLFDRYDTDYLK